MNLAVYIACHDQELALDLAVYLRGEGFAITSRWLAKPFGPSNTFPETDRWGFANDNFDDVRISDALVLIAGPDRYSGGKFVETGFAYALGKHVVIFGRRENMQCYGNHMKAVVTREELVEVLMQAAAADFGWHLDTSPETETSNEVWYRHGSTGERKRLEDVFALIRTLDRIEHDGQK